MQEEVRLGALITILPRIAADHDGRVAGALSIIVHEVPRHAVLRVMKPIRSVLAADA